jgi:hypothetical protein
VRELVGDDGRRIADFMLGVLDDETERTETRLKAAEWLAGARLRQGADASRAFGRKRRRLSCGARSTSPRVSVLPTSFA